MKQVLQSYKSGELRLADVPAPTARRGRVVVRTRASVISPGTERMVLDLARRSLVGKAMERPDQVKRVVDKVRRDGLLQTMAAVRSRLEEPLALGYSAMGEVIALGDVDAPFAIGDRVACTGMGWASHAEFVTVPYNLCARVPEGVDDASAALSGIAAMALHGVRQGGVGLGDRVAVIGLGLLGQIAVRLCLAAGATVIGVDPVADRVAIAEAAGAIAFPRDRDGLVDAVLAASGGVGVDSALIFAATTDSDPVCLAAALCRERGTVVAVGATGLEVPRRAFYDKELRLELSRSTGPGRYDPVFELEGIDYPIGYVRWTQTRNLDAWLRLCASGAVDPGPLLGTRHPHAAAVAAYDALGEPGATLAVVLEYGAPAAAASSVEIGPPQAAGDVSGEVSVAMVGAGRYASDVLAPALMRTHGVSLRTVVSDRGVSASALAERFGFRTAATDADAALRDADHDLAVIVTPHHLHAGQAAAALRAGRHVFVEKPLAIDRVGLDEVLAAYGERDDTVLCVGFNRRWAPLVRAAKTHFEPVRAAPAVISIAIAAGAIPSDHWIQDPARGGGRIVGELCHWVDLACFLRDATVVDVHARMVVGARRPTRNDDQVVVSLGLSDGSIATLAYASGSDGRAPKETIAIHAGGRSAQLVDHRALECFADGRRTTSRLARPDKGQRAMIEALVSALRVGRAGQAGLLPIHQIESVHAACLEARDQLTRAR